MTDVLMVVLLLAAGVGWVYRAYEDLVRFVRLVQEAQG